MPEMVPPAMGMDLGGTKTDPFWVAKKMDPSWKLLAIPAIPSYPHDILVVPSIFSLPIPYSHDIDTMYPILLPS